MFRFVVALLVIAIAGLLMFAVVQREPQLVSRTLPQVIERNTNTIQVPTAVQPQAVTVPPQRQNYGESIANAPTPPAQTASDPAKADKDYRPGKVSGDFVNNAYTLREEIAVNGFKKDLPVVIVVDKGSHFTYVLQKQEGDRVVKVWSASNAVGKETTPTAKGRFTVVDKTKWPSWVPPKSIDPDQKAIHPYNKDRSNPLGVARLRLNKWEMALHGTNAPDQIRQDVSHGCIRHSNKDILKMFEMARVGTPVYVVDKFVGTKIPRQDFEA